MAFRRMLGGVKRPCRGRSASARSMRRKEKVLISYGDRADLRTGDLVEGEAR